MVLFTFSQWTPNPKQNFFISNPHPRRCWIRSVAMVRVLLSSSWSGLAQEHSCLSVLFFKRRPTVWSPSRKSDAHRSIYEIKSSRLLRNEFWKARLKAPPEADDVCGTASLPVHTYSQKLHSLCVITVCHSFAATWHKVFYELFKKGTWYGKMDFNGLYT